MNQSPTDPAQPAENHSLLTAFVQNLAGAAGIVADYLVERQKYSIRRTNDQMEITSLQSCFINNAAECGWFYKEAACLLVKAENRLTLGDKKRYSANYYVRQNINATRSKRNLSK